MILLLGFDGHEARLAFRNGDVRRYQETVDVGLRDIVTNGHISQNKVLSPPAVSVDLGGGIGSDILPRLLGSLLAVERDAEVRDELLVRIQ
jgi:hypothetical protein